MNGNNILVYQSTDSGTTWAAIAGTKSDTIQVGSEMIPISSPDDGQWEHCIAGRKNWSLASGWLVADGVDLRKVLTVGTRVKLKIKGRGDTDGNGLVGFAWIQAAEITATRGNLSQGSFKFKGDGPLE